jgi:precorrin-4/cobalt-precorrin-4 C11-methyltransferase
VTVHFIGAGPGAADLITVRGLRLIESCPVCIYAGSLVPKEVVASAPKDARLVDSSALTLNEIIAEIEAAYAKGHDVARVHSGDPSIYGAMAEQMRRLDALGIPYDVTPGVPAFVAAAAAMKQELTIPEINQTIILTRTSVKSSAMPEGEDLATLGKSGATLVIHLSIRNLAKIETELTPLYGSDCPVVVAYRIGWQMSRFCAENCRTLWRKWGFLASKERRWCSLGADLIQRIFRDSALYNDAHSHIARSKLEG